MQGSLLGYKAVERSLPSPQNRMRAWAGAEEVGTVTLWHPGAVPLPQHGLVGQGQVWDREKKISSSPGAPQLCSGLQSRGLASAGRKGTETDRGARIFH